MIDETKKEVVVVKEPKVVEVKLSKEEQAVKDDQDLIVSIQTQQTEKTMEDRIMLHALVTADQISKSLEEKLAADFKDPMIIAGLKDGLMEAKLELEEARKMFNVAKEKEAKIAAIR